MDKFRYIHSLNEIMMGLDSKENYPLYHLVDELNLKVISRKGDFITVLNDEGEKQVFSLSHMVNKRVIRPDEHLFKVEYIGSHDNRIKHQPGLKIKDEEALFTVLKSYGFDYFYTLLSVEELILSLKAEAFLSSANKKNDGYNASSFFESKISGKITSIEYKDNISHFVRLHYRPQNDMLLAFHHAFKRLGKAHVLIGLDPHLLVDQTLKVYPLPNAGLDLIYDAHFYQLNLKEENFEVHHFEKYDFVAMFSSYDNHAHSTMVRGAEVLVFNVLPTHYVRKLIFENENDKEQFLVQAKELGIAEQLVIEVDASQFT